MSQHSDSYKFFAFCYFDSKKASVQISTDEKTGRGKLVITGPKDKESGKKMGGTIVLPKGADVSKAIKVEKDKGLNITVSKLPEFVTAAAC